MDKFHRNYVLRVQANTPDREFIRIEPPFTIEFDITRNILPSANTSRIRIYNLSEKNRNLILHNLFDYSDLRLVILQAGYGTDSENFPVIFAGHIGQAFSVREGTNFITQIEAFDGGFAFINAHVGQTAISGSTQVSIILALANSLSQFGVKTGAIGNFEGTTIKQESFSGNPIDVLAELTSGGVFIDNNKINVLKDNEYIDDEVTFIVNSESGLLGTPIREPTRLIFDILFEPRLFIGQRIKIQSITQPIYNGYFKIAGIHHKGMISEAVCGDATTNVIVFNGIGNLTPVSQRTA